MMGSTQIIRAIAVTYHMPISKIRSSRKTRSIAKVRHIVMICLRKHGLSFSEIGRLLNKDHTTVLWACRNASPALNSEADRVYDRIRTYVPKEPIQKAGWDPTQGRWNGLFKVYIAACQVCGFDDIVAVHHVTPRKNGGSDEPENLLILCPNHHAMLHMGNLLLKDVPNKRFITISPTI